MADLGIKTDMLAPTEEAPVKFLEGRTKSITSTIQKKIDIALFEGPGDLHAPMEESPVKFVQRTTGRIISTHATNDNLDHTETATPDNDAYLSAEEEEPLEVTGVGLKPRITATEERVPKKVGVRFKKIEEDAKASSAAVAPSVSDAAPSDTGAAGDVTPSDAAPSDTDSGSSSNSGGLPRNSNGNGNNRAKEPRPTDSDPEMEAVVARAEQEIRDLQEAARLKQEGKTVNPVQEAAKKVRNAKKEKQAAKLRTEREKKVNPSNDPVLAKKHEEVTAAYGEGMIGIMQADLDKLKATYKTMDFRGLQILEPVLSHALMKDAATNEEIYRRTQFAKDMYNHTAMISYLDSCIQVAMADDYFVEIDAKKYCGATFKRKIRDSAKIEGGHATFLWLLAAETFLRAIAYGAGDTKRAQDEAWELLDWKQDNLPTVPEQDSAEYTQVAEGMITLATAQYPRTFPEIMKARAAAEKEKAETASLRAATKEALAKKKSAAVGGGGGVTGAVAEAANPGTSSSAEAAGSGAAGPSSDGLPLPEESNPLPRKRVGRQATSPEELDGLVTDMNDVMETMKREVDARQ